MKLEQFATETASADADDSLPCCHSIVEICDDASGPHALLTEFDPTLSFRDAKERAITRWERWYVAQLLRHTKGNLSEAARIAHSDRGHLRKLARKHLQRGGTQTAD